MVFSSNSSAISHEEKHEIQEKYDVFLSFRGEDRNTFASYPYGAVSAKQILTFMDDHELERNERAGYANLLRHRSISCTKKNGSYGAAFAQLENRFMDRMDKVNQWRAAVTEASNLCGLDSKDFR
ncbi:disease resistance protein Roq1-like [Ziziphus jujuba]|uniref:ADP-ribosyl cyclase/cyclic ADP-ribose hydrolase n=1 Tax=Ziziphus jujuba TaxID=326968 RepID=A0ABM4AB46_ZIZJJ|nr:disease resistance protein Roq1-like [Ziziphus jujuba]